MKYSKEIAITTMALSISLVGCSSSSNSTTNADPVNIPADQSVSPANETSMPAPDAGGTNNDVAGTGDPALNGTWTTGCFEDLIDSYEIGTLVISGATATETFATYSDSTCSTRDAEPVEEITFSMEFPAGVVETGLGTARFINITPESFTVGGQPVPSVTAFNTLYDIYLVSGDTLYLGLDGDVSESPQTRPSQLDTDEPLTRQ